ncbi:membrane-bound lytic murein transglycosylase B-like protein [Desulfatibacillum aliphaticivorans]|uniref:Membrane-bound lytic murein transglycosylase B-like protein n=1 Tax=Desulfatibacillum aliphaticivorans TaxID=218208 RepID=B8FL09_DESAL|nr:lytic murein transglycosylase [Desulfatibacillum aliphaticivorans]ACL04644.1 membrane-bound lytic murein transglycosylase B-like protein [Desulfatibacillum aliphaticivorans]
MLNRFVGLFAALILACLPVAPAMASEPAAPPFEALKKRLIQDGFTEAQLDKIYGAQNVKLDLSVATVYFRHNESKLNYDQFLEDKPIAGARAYMKEHQADLEAAEKTYGVDQEVITAILLVETRLGGYVGTKPVINTLSTLASLSEQEKKDQLYDEVSRKKKTTKKKVESWADRKSSWAYVELKAFLKHLDPDEADPASIKGSFAGAMGYSQFMPSNISVHGADGSGDGKVDLFTHSDAIASIGKYLKNHGWKPGMDAEKMKKVLLSYNNSTYYANTLLRIRAVLKGAS